MKFLSSYQLQTAQCLQICCVSAVKLNDFATFVIFDVSACMGVLVKLGLVWTGGGPSGCAKEVPNIAWVRINFSFPGCVESNLPKVRSI